jgi:hypothetical protein
MFKINVNYGMAFAVHVHEYNRYVKSSGDVKRIGNETIQDQRIGNRGQTQYSPTRIPHDGNEESSPRRLVEGFPEARTLIPYLIIRSARVERIPAE